MKFHFWVKSVSLVALTASLIPLVSAPGLTATFQPPAENSAPNRATGGASRGEFIPPANNSAPGRATGGASRGEFIPPANNSAPSQASGGASRADFVLPDDNMAPSQASGGASRADFVLPDNQSAPSQTVGGSSRANTYGFNSALSSRSMMAVMPESFYGNTLLARPTFMAYLPESGVQEAVFSLKDEAGNLVYRTEMPISGEAGIIAIALPTEAPALEVGENYQWFVALKLDGALTPNSPFVDGWIKRIEPSAALTEALTEEDVLANAEALAEKGVWYDSAALFAQLYLEQPANAAIVQHWQEFLNSVSLDELIEASIEVASLTD